MRSTKVISTVVIAAALIGPTGFHASAAVSDRDRPAKVSALKLLHHLRTAHERNAGYNRDKFADWLDRDGDACDTRAEVLIDESLRRVRKGSGCYVRTGKWFSKDDGRVFKRASNLDIDHMVPLAEAWGSGAKTWNSATRARYSNDLGYPFSLIALSASANRAKGDRDPAEWMPPRKQFHCQYAKEYTAVKFRWHLRVNSAERKKLRHTIKQCSDRRITRPHRAVIHHHKSGHGGGGHHGGRH